MALNYQDSVQDVSTSAGTGAFTPSGTPPDSWRPFSVHTVGDTFEYRAFAGAQWEIGDGTWTGTNITRSPRASSSGNGLVNFTTAPTVWECVTAATIKRMLMGGDVLFSQTIPLSTPGTTYMEAKTVTGALTFTPAANAVRNALVYLRLTANGSNAPDVTAFDKAGGSADYVNTAGTVNIMQFFHDGVRSRVYIDQDTAAGASVPASATVSGVTVNPSTVTVAGGGTQTFTAAVAGTNSPAQTVTWTTTAGTITSGGVLTAPAATSSAQTITVRATSTVDASKSGAATVTVAATAPAGSTVSGVTVAPTTANVAGGATQQFTAAVAGANSPAQTVTWTATAGTISSSGLFTAPAATASTQTVTVTATSTQDGTKTGTATATVAAAAAAGYPQFPTRVQTTESGTGPYNYTGTGTNTNIYDAAYGAVTAKSLAAGVDGYMDFTVSTYATEFMIGFSLGGTVTNPMNVRYYLYASGGTGGAPGSYKHAGVNVGTGTNVGGIVPAAGDILRLRRIGNLLKIYCARAATPTTFVEMDSFDYGSAPAMWIQATMTTTSALQLLAWSGFA